MSVTQLIPQSRKLCRWHLVFLLVVTAYCANGQSPFEEIIKISLDSARVLLQESTELESQTLATYQIGRRYMRSDIDSSVYFLEKAIAMSVRVGDPELINRMKKTLTFALIDNQQLRKAEELLYEIKPFFETFRNGELYKSWCSNIGYLMTESGRFDEAIIYFTDAFELASEEGDYQSMNNLLNRIGIVYSRIGVTGRALEYYEKVIYNCEALGEKYMYSAALYNAAVILQGFDQSERASSYFQKVIDIRKYHSSERMKRSVLNARSHVAEITGDISQAILHSDSCLLLVRQLNLKNSILSQYLRLQHLHSLGGDLEKADAYLEMAYELKNSVANIANERELLSRYAAMLSRKRDFRSAYRIRTVLDSISDIRDLKVGESRMIKLEISEVQRLRNIELENLKSESQHIKIELEKKNNERLFFIVLSILLLGILGLLYSHSRSRKRINKELEEKNTIITKSLQEKNTLMKEIHHRVKNNLQIVSSMLSLQLRYINDDSAKEVMMESRDRVKSMALLHQKLYQEDILKGVFMPTYLESLISSLSNSYKLDGLGIYVDCDADDIWIDVDTAMPIGMIVNELTTNAIKHAFDEDGGKIHITLMRSQNLLVLRVSDDGVGVDQDFNLQDKDCFGFRMINSFVRKLKGQLAVQSSSGTTIEISIKNFKELYV